MRLILNTEKIARLISVLLGPHVWLPVLLIISLLKSSLTKDQLYILIPSLVIFQIVVPIAYIHIALSLGKVSAWDLPKKEERYLFLGISLISYLISVLMIYLFGNHFLFSLSLIMLILLIILATTTYYWKISLHSSMNTAGAILINFLFTWNLPWLYLVIPLIIWARYQLKRHDVPQLVAGMIVSGVTVLLLLRLFGLSDW